MCPKFSFRKILETINLLLDSCLIKMLNFIPISTHIEMIIGRLLRHGQDVGTDSEGWSSSCNNRSAVIGHITVRSASSYERHNIAHGFYKWLKGVLYLRYFSDFLLTHPVTGQILRGVVYITAV